MNTTTAITPPPPSANRADARASADDARTTPRAEWQSERLTSLDTFRGITIAGMLLVNNPGTWAHIYAPLRHAEWHGWTPTDLIFPFFLFIVGVAMTFSFAKQAERGHTRLNLLRKSAKRAAILFALGLVLHGFPTYDLSSMRIPGVLQRIALAYLAASAIVLYLKPRGQAIALAVLLLGYWALQTLVPVPGMGAPSLEPGRDLGAYIDRLIFTEAHLWSQARTWDPEGLLSTLPAIGTVLCGVFTGYWLRSPHTNATRKTALLAAAGVAALALGSLWGLAFPINKNLWTSSYVVFTAGFAAILLAACYWLVDVRGHDRWLRPFTIYGMNAIAAFFLSGLFARMLGLIRVGDSTLKGWIFENAYLSWASPINASLAFAITFVLLWLGIMWLFYRRGIFIKV